MPVCEQRCKRHIRKEISGELIVSGGHPSKVLEAAESIFDPMSFAVAASIEGYFTLAVGWAWNDGNYYCGTQILTKSIRVVTFISQQTSGTAQAAQAAQQGRGGCDVGHVGGGENQGEWAAEDVGEPM
jgi:hypothetical protein